MGYEQPIVDADAEGPTRHKLTVEEFLILDEAGAFPTKYVELVDGEIFVMSPVYIPHARTMSAMMYEVAADVRQLSGGLICYSPVSTLIDNFNLPMPDLVIAEDDGGDRFMAPEAVRLIIEISSSTLRHDLVKKAGLYARAMLPEYWVVDVKGRRIVQMSRPDTGDYAERTEFGFGQPVTSATIPGLIVDTASL